jgi:hypothetical protein
MSDERPNSIMDRARMLHEERERDRKNWAAFGKVNDEGLSIYRGPNWDKVQEMLGDRVSTKVEYSVDGQHWMPEPPEKTGILYIRETWE